MVSMWTKPQSLKVMKWHVLFSIIIVLFLGACSRRVTGTLVSDTSTKVECNTQSVSGSDYFEEETWYALEDESAISSGILNSHFVPDQDSIPKKPKVKNKKKRQRLVPVAKRTLSKTKFMNEVNVSRNDSVSHEDMTYKEKYTPDNRVLYFSMMLLFVVIICLFVYFVCNNKK